MYVLLDLFERHINMSTFTFGKLFVLMEHMPSGLTVYKPGSSALGLLSDDYFFENFPAPITVIINSVSSLGPFQKIDQRL